MDCRTVRDFTFTGDVWAQVEAWAGRHGYRLKENQADQRTYQKGRALLVAPMMLSLGTKGSAVHMEAWVRVPMISRALALFILPGEMHIASGGFKGLVPRKMARTAVNDLLGSLGQPVIE
jgi:hypothetical protein